MTDYKEDLATIRGIMEKRTKFISLSGMAGISAGSFALIGAFLAYRTIYFSNEIIYYSLKDLEMSGGTGKLLAIAILVFLVSSFSGWLLSYRKSKKMGAEFWNPTAKRMLLSFAVPLITGGVFCVMLLLRNEVALIAPCMLIFYGLAVFSAGNYTFGDVKTLGILEIIIGLVAYAFPGYGLYFWAIGFGVLHILYGTIMYFRYDR